MNLRFATEADVPALLAIYAHYIPTTITFEYELPSAAEFTQRVSSVSEVYPYLAAIQDGTVLGYAYAHRIASRAAYGWGAELSIYLHPNATGKRAGTRLYRALMELLRLQGVRTVCGLVASPNPASERLHTSLGFRLMGVQQKAGYKNGRWIDLLWFEKAIALYSPEPAPLIPVRELPENLIQSTLDHF